jgi:hypothetical protein
VYQWADKLAPTRSSRNDHHRFRGCGASAFGAPVAKTRRRHANSAIATTRNPIKTNAAITRPRASRQSAYQEVALMLRQGQTAALNVLGNRTNFTTVPLF